MKQIRRTNTLSGRPSSGVCCDEARASILSGDVEDALRHLRRAVEIDGDDVTAWQLLGHCFERLGQDKRARRCYTLAFRLSLAPGRRAARSGMEPLPILRLPRTPQDL